MKKSIVFISLLLLALVFPRCTNKNVSQADEEKYLTDSIRLARFVVDSTTAAKVKAAEQARASKQHFIDSIVAANAKPQKVMCVTIHQTETVTSQSAKVNRVDQIHQKEIGDTLENAITEERLKQEVAELVTLIQKKVQPVPYKQETAPGIWSYSGTMMYYYGPLWLGKKPSGSMYLQVTETLGKMSIMDQDADGLQTKNTKDNEADEYGFVYDGFYSSKNETGKAKARADYLKTVQYYKKKLQVLPDAS